MQSDNREIALAELIELWHSSQQAADKIFSHYDKKRRYIGGNDRRFLQKGFYYYLRHKLAVDYFIEKHEWQQQPSNFAIIALYLAGEVLSDHGVQYFSDPSLLTQDYREKFIANLPESVICQMPNWLLGKLKNLPESENLCRALSCEAKVNLRVSPFVDLEKIMSDLQQTGCDCVRGKISPLAIHLDKRVSANYPAFKQGAVDYQDEGAQIVSFVIIELLRKQQNIENGSAAEKQNLGDLLDYCSGSGGKIFALADFANLNGDVIQFSAYDIYQKKIDNFKRRLRKYQQAHTELGKQHLLNHVDIYTRKPKRKFHAVLADVPCSLTGVLRRAPERKWKLSEDHLMGFMNKQLKIMDNAAALTQSGGWLFYVTCSLLQQENEAQVEKFMAKHSKFALVNLATTLPKNSVHAKIFCNQTMQKPSPYLQLRPDWHDCDGFFMAAFNNAAVEE